jgi:hypothetical protein
MNNLPNIIGITGKKQHGKDTMGDYLVKNYGYKRLAFADAIKEVVKNSFGFTEEQLNGSLKDTVDDFWKVKPRQVFQFVGTELFRNKMSELIPEVESNIWVIIIYKKILDEWIVNPTAKFVITDLRFPNELNLINSLNGFTVRIDNPNVLSNLESNHESETNIDGLMVQSTIVNDGSIVDFYKSIDQLLRERV